MSAMAEKPGTPRVVRNRLLMARSGCSALLTACRKAVTHSQFSPDWCDSPDRPKNGRSQHVVCFYQHDVDFKSGAVLVS